MNDGVLLARADGTQSVGYPGPLIRGEKSMAGSVFSASARLLKLLRRSWLWGVGVVSGCIAAIAYPGVTTG